MNTGSLRIIQNGADFQTLAVIENMGNFSKIWSLRNRFRDTYVFLYRLESQGDAFCRNDSHILAANSQESILFRLDRPDTLSAVARHNAGFESCPTLAASNVARRLRNHTGRTSYEDSSLVVQVTEEKIILLEYDDVLQTHNVLTSWSPDEQGDEWAGRKIVVASLNPSQFALGLSRKRLVLLNLSENNTFQIFRYANSLCM
jgi:DNA damage-binding protein 1